MTPAEYYESLARQFAEKGAARDRRWAAMIRERGYWHPFMNEVARYNLGMGNEMTAALGRVKDWSIAIDGGAQVGRVANRLAEKFGKVYAIELARENFECLVRNARPNVVPIHGCLCDGAGRFDYEPDKHPDSPVYRAIPNFAGRVPAITIDELALPSCGFIKPDLQGFDYLALKGAEHTLMRFRPPVYVEVDPSCMGRYGIRRNAPEIFMRSLGYKYLGTEDDNQAWA